MQEELNKVKAEKDVLSKELFGFKQQNEGSVGRIEELVFQNKKLGASKEELEARISALCIELANIKTELDQKRLQASTQQEKADKLQAELKSEKAENEKMNKALQAVISALEKFTSTQSAIESTLSCLSCLEYLKEPSP